MCVLNAVCKNYFDSHYSFAVCNNAGKKDVYALQLCNADGKNGCLCFTVCNPADKKAVYALQYVTLQLKRLYAL